MEVAMCTITGELVSRFISFLMNKYHSSSNTQSEEKKMMERLQHLLMRAGTIVEEADAPYITNSWMIMQLKMLSEAMYRGHRVLDIFMYRTLEDTGLDEEFPSSILENQLTRMHGEKAMHVCAMESLEVVVANMAEFVRVNWIDATTILSYLRNATVNFIFRKTPLQFSIHSTDAIVSNSAHIPANILAYS